MSCTGTGMRDWLAQRLTAVVILFWVVWLFTGLCELGTVSFVGWSSLFKTTAGKYLTFLAMLSILFHAWIGVWTVATDYIKPVLIRKTFLYFVFFALVLHALWGTTILWGGA